MCAWWSWGRLDKRAEETSEAGMAVLQGGSAAIPAGFHEAQAGFSP
ncbi:hypothetical protein J27TS7_26420 [Paenibacillus dendritiformis]|nr:hypothetical protein J27TS7_26420 [Paenibacillus dendritiformis]